MSVAQVPHTSRNDAEPGKTSVILETLAIFYVLASIVAMILAMTTVLQTGFR